MCKIAQPAVPFESYPLLNGHGLTAFTLLSSSETLFSSHPINTAPSMSASLGGRSLPSPFFSHSLTRTLARSGAERLNGGRWKGLCSHFSAPVPGLVSVGCGGKKTAAVHRCRFHFMVMHVSVDMLDVFTWTRKCVIWFPERPPSCHLTRSFRPGIKHLPWERAKKSVLDFILSASKGNISIRLLMWMAQMLCRLRPVLEPIY